MPEREGKFDETALVVPTEDTMADWINQSKAFGAMLKDLGTNAALGLTKTQTTELEQHYGTAMEIDHNDTFARATQGGNLLGT